MKALFWSVVYTRDSQPLAAFCDLALAEAYVLKEPAARETIINRSIAIGGESVLSVRLGVCERLLRDIVSNDFSVEGDTRMMRAIEEARKLLKVAK